MGNPYAGMQAAAILAFVVLLFIVGSCGYGVRCATEKYQLHIDVTKKL